MSTTTQTSNAKGSPSVAYCFYGQYRTADYCLPWIAETVGTTDNLRAVFVSTKVMNTYPNSQGAQAERAKSSSIVSNLLGVWPQAKIHIDPVVHHVLDPKKGYWNYARMFWSMNKAYQMYCDWAEANGDVDLLVFHRLDALTGPNPTTLSSYLKHLQVVPYALWCDNGHIRFHYNEFGLGVSDLTLVGSPFAMGTILSYSTDCMVHRPKQGWHKFMHGPNIQLKNAADAASLTIFKLAGETALVRPNADLTLPVFESFTYHSKFWRQAHKGSNEGFK